MLEQYVVNQILELLAEGGWSRRQIAKKVGVSRGSVNAIANGNRGHFGRQPMEGSDAGPQVARCPQCGVRVILPCVACRARDYRGRQHSGSADTRELKLQGASGTASRTRVPDSQVA